ERRGSSLTSLAGEALWRCVLAGDSVRNTSRQQTACGARGAHRCFGLILSSRLPAFAAAGAFNADFTGDLATGHRQVSHEAQQKHESCGNENNLPGHVLV